MENIMPMITGSVGSNVVLRLLDLSFKEYILDLQRNVLHATDRFGPEWKPPDPIQGSTRESVEAVVPSAESGPPNSFQGIGGKEKKLYVTAGGETLTQEVARLRSEVQNLRDQLMLADGWKDRFTSSVHECSRLRAELQVVQAESRSHAEDLQRSLQELGAASQAVSDRADAGDAEKTAAQAALAGHVQSAAQTGAGLNSLDVAVGQVEKMLFAALQPLRALSA
jgi:hypothetical protein